ncbi:VOC family protein [Streptomyces sp. NRRL F-5135]|uniref:VOC family protein n=1 Tax=Streptomyces sp. NRRL F-5135 TaxID=1463858 RepID=UPI0004C630AC|nr:VOC family protein [Streptomyces sp. NRRL F-5135]
MAEEAIRRTPGTPCWVSLMVSDLAATEEFYGGLFGWEFEPGPQQLGPYVRGLLDGREVAGIGRLPGGRRLPTAWLTYLATDDADKTAETIRSCGGTVAVGPLEAAEAGRMAIAADPAGAVLGIWQAAAHPGTAVSGPPGTPVWNELFTRETASVARFYESLFGYEVEPAGPAGTDELTLRLEDRPVGSLHGLGRALPRDRGAHWMTSFEVADTDAAARLVTDLGGRLLEAPRDAGRGRTATVTDPEGAVFTIVCSGAR